MALPLKMVACPGRLPQGRSGIVRDPRRSEVENEPTYVTASSRVWFLRTGTDTAGEVHDQRVEYLPGSPFPPVHFHPSQDEHFEIESGELLFEIDGEQRVIRAGDAIDIPRGTRHRARNPSANESAVVRWETRPALRSSEFYDLENRLGGSMSTVDHAMFAYEYRDVLRLPGAMGALVALVATVARLAGRHPSASQS